MKAINTIIFILSILCVSCGGSQQNTTDTADTAEAQLPQSFYKRYQGTIAGQPVVMHLQKTGNVYDGIYTYTKAGAWMNLSVDSVTQDTVYFSEFFAGDNWSQSDTIRNARLHCAITAASVRGTWISGNGQKHFDIDLHEAYPEGSYKFSIQEFSDSLSAYPSIQGSPAAQVDCYFPVPQTGNKWLEAELKKILGFDSTHLDADYKEGIAKLNKSYFEQYKANLPDLKDTAEGMPLQSLNYASSQTISIRYNDNGIVVLESMVYDYSGGAHGNYGSTLYCLDVKAGKQLRLSDIINADSATLQPIVEECFRAQYHITADSLNEVLFDNSLALNDNFYLTGKGIGFIYNPYEVASYAQGQINVFVPFKTLDKFILPSFKQRMKLN